MSERETKPPIWGPVTDPAPWHTHFPWPDPIPLIWKRVPFPDPGDPIPFPYRILEQIQIQDVIALRQANLDAVNQVFQAQLKAERALLEAQKEILAKYK
jgi:hypothetical protein